GMLERRCRYCERIFQPSKYQPGQSVCSDPGCQRRRRAEYHRQKIVADPEYRQVCLDNPQKWRSRNPDYWRRYREQHPAAVERNLRMRWRTIKKYLDAPAQEPAQRQRDSKLDPFKTTIAEWLQKDPSVTAAVIEQKLRPLGYRGGHTILREYVHPARPQLKPN